MTVQQVAPGVMSSTRVSETQQVLLQKLRAAQHRTVIGERRHKPAKNNNTVVQQRFSGCGRRHQKVLGAVLLLEGPVRAEDLKNSECEEQGSLKVDSTGSPARTEGQKPARPGVHRQEPKSTKEQQVKTYQEYQSRTEVLHKEELTRILQLPLSL